MSAVWPYYYVDRRCGAVASFACHDFDENAPGITLADLSEHGVDWILVCE